MKVSMNFTTSPDDVARYASSQELEEMLEGFDGLELMWCGEDERGIIPQGRVTGVHLRCPTNWVDLWNGDEEALLKEYGSLEVVEQVFGGTTRQALLQRFGEDLAAAHRYGAEYVVFHASDVWLAESIQFGNFHLSHEAVIQACCELIDALAAEEDGSLAFLLENLWGAGLDMTNPALTRQLMEGISYENKGIMLDTGHLLHTNFELKTQDQAVDYLMERLDAHGDACSWVRGMHLNQSLTGEFCKGLIANPPQLPQDYWERWGAMFALAFQIDLHKPFTTPRICQVISRLPLEYLTFEFITNTVEEHREYISQQWKALESLNLRK